MTKTQIAKKALVTEYLGLSASKRGLDYDASEIKEINRRSATVLRSDIAKMADLPDYVVDPSIADVPEAFDHSYSYMMNFHKGTQAAAAAPAPVAPVTPKNKTSDAQMKFIVKLFLEKHGINLEDEKHAALLAGVKQLGKFKASREIDNLKALPTLRAVKPIIAPDAAPTALPAIPDGIYAIHADGEPKCYEISNGKAGSKWAGFIFLDRVSSDDRYSIRNRDEKARILDAIREDVESAGRLAAQILRQCRNPKCKRTLSDTKNPYFEMGYGPICGAGGLD